MNVSELNDVQIKALLYDLTGEFERLRQSIIALEGELKRRATAEQSPAPDEDTSESDEDASESDEDASEEEEAEASSSED